MLTFLDWTAQFGRRKMFCSSVTKSLIKRGEDRKEIGTKAPKGQERRYFLGLLLHTGHRLWAVANLSATTR